MSFAMDRLAPVPKFYSVKEEHPVHRILPGIVLAEADVHFSRGYVTMGYVSLQTPFGQGVYMGLKKKDLRRAERLEIAFAISLMPHPHGKDFRPACLDGSEAQYQALMARWDEITQQQIAAIVKEHRLEPLIDVVKHLYAETLHT
jgi:hypothetical protein